MLRMEAEVVGLCMTVDEVEIRVWWVARWGAECGLLSNVDIISVLVDHACGDNVCWRETIAGAGPPVPNQTTQEDQDRIPVILEQIRGGLV